MKALDLSVGNGQKKTAFAAKRRKPFFRRKKVTITFAASLLSCAKNHSF